MASKRSWAEGRWWRGARRDYLGVVVLFPLILFGFHALTIRQMAAPPLQQFYIDAYRASCTVVRRPLALPYVQQANGSQRLAGVRDLVVLPSSATSGLRVTLSQTAVATGVQRLQFLRFSGDGLSRACGELNGQIQANRLAVRSRIPPLLLGGLALGIVALVVSVSRARSVAGKMRRGHLLLNREA